MMVGMRVVIVVVDGVCWTLASIFMRSWLDDDDAVSWILSDREEADG